ncbi:DUF4398 domain-containing protein [bacterium]|jgi:hypothetical protein|nr:DUF4398 domain-containing protein [bacterium]
MPSLFWVTLLGLVLGITFSSCSLMATRPAQEMANTAAAIRAAREVQADVHSPVFFLQAIEWLDRAKKEYRYKNFDLAETYAQYSRKYAERAEFEAMRNGATRHDSSGPDPLTTTLQPPPPPDQSSQ